MEPSVRIAFIHGVLELELPAFKDSRGSFLNLYGLNEPCFASAYHSCGHRAWPTFTDCSYPEAKLVRCLRGRIWDVAVDLRMDSLSYGKRHAVGLSVDVSIALVIPEGCAHGFQVLEPGSELLSLHSGSWVPEAETGVRFDDPQLHIRWPLSPLGISQRDLALSRLKSLRLASTTAVTVDHRLSKW